VQELRLAAAGDVDERGGAALEVGRCAIDDEMARVEPAPAAEPAAPATSSLGRSFFPASGAPPRFARPALLEDSLARAGGGAPTEMTMVLPGTFSLMV